VAAFALLVIGAWVWRLVHRPPKDLDPNLLAVAPFDVRGEPLESWREGLVDYLSRSLDGAGALQTVPPTRFLRNWSGRSDRASAQALGRATGAGLVVFGSALMGGRDSVRLRAALLNLSAGTPPVEVEIRGDTAGIDRCADSLALAVLRQLGSDRAVAAVRKTPFGGVSIPALKEYLQGEQLYRHGLWDSALVHYSRATALDSGFALAYRRMFLVLGWTPSTRQRFEPAGVYGLKAGALNHGLSSRDSLLLLADSIALAINVEDGEFFPMYRRLFATLETAAGRYPADPEVWQAVGEARFHIGQPPFTPAEILEAFDRAIALDSGFSPAYEHTIHLAMKIGGPDLARRYTRPYPLLGSTDGNAPSLLLTAALLEAERSGEISVAPLVDTAQLTPLFRAGLEMLGTSPDSAEFAVQVLRRLAAGRHRGDSEPWVTDSLMWPKYLASVLLFRGHVQEAFAVYAPRIARPDTMPWAMFADPFLDVALLDTTKADIAAAWFRARPLAPLPWLVARGDTAGLRKFIAKAREGSRESRGAGARLTAEYKARAGEAYLPLIEGDSAGALRALESLPDSVCLLAVSCFHQKLTQARLLSAAGDDRAAADLLDRWRWTAAGPFFVIAALERAQLAERLGERELGITLFQRVVDTWRRADPELQPYVAEARAGLQRLTKEPRP
jgi:serine/threonine-protein kinase